ncbi:MAG TPA: hypothetical protein VHZ97_23620 [Pseudonocardiaceae bacterium]|nr:hypothetical protein [Pseudonocardiaceae bacterium]
MNSGPGALPVVVGLAVIVLLVITRTRGQQVRAARLLILPVIVLVAGGAAMLPSLSHLRPVDVVIIVIDVLLSLGLGFARGVSVLIYPQDGATWYRYGTVTVVLWAVSIALRFVLGFVGVHVGGSQLVTSSSVLFMLGLSLITQNIVALVRSRQVSGQPARLG